LKHRRIGVISPFYLVLPDLKRIGLYFDVLHTQTQFAYQVLESARRHMNDEDFENKPSAVAKLSSAFETLDNWIGRGLVEDIEPLIGSSSEKLVQDLRDNKKTWALMGKLASWGRHERYLTFLEALEKTLVVVPQFDKAFCRSAANELQKMDYCASPVYLGQSDLEGAFTSEGKLNACLSAVIRSLPVPSESVTWKEILDFRDNPDTQRKLRALHVWQNDVAREDLSPAEVMDKLAHLLDDYAEHMRINRLRHEMTTAEIILTIGAEVLEGLLHLKPTKAIKALFSFGRRDLDLKEVELKAPGHEVAFICKAKESFGK